MGYIPYWHIYTKHNPNNHNKQAKNIWEEDGMVINKENMDKRFEGNIVCVHKDQSQPSGLKIAVSGSNIFSFLSDYGLV